MRTKLLIYTLGTFSALSFLGLSAQEAKGTKENGNLSKSSGKIELLKKIEYKSSLLHILKKQQQLEAGLQVSSLKKASDTIFIDIPVSLIMNSESLAYLKSRNINTASLSKSVKKNSSKIQVSLSSSEQLEDLIQELSEKLELARLQLSLLS